MTSELISALFKRRSTVEAAGKTWESCPAEPSADASYLEGLGLAFSAPNAQEWLQQAEKTQEEDMLAEALAEELAQRGEAGPLHAPDALSPEEAARLEAVAASLLELRQKLAGIKESQTVEWEELSKREEELCTREAELEAETEKQRQQEEAQSNYPHPPWLTNRRGTINIGVVGNSGVGKSLLINKLRRLPAHAQGWAPVGVNETTREPTMYSFSDQPKVRLWDLPGAGTAAVPAVTYVQDMGLRYFDKVIIVQAGRFTSIDVELKDELDKHKVPFFMVRSKVDIDVWNNKEDNGMEEAATVVQIVDDLKKNQGVSNPYLISSRDLEAYDMPRLVNDLFPSLQRQNAPVAFEKAAPVWNDPWMMPAMFSLALTGLQGRWRDAWHAVFIISGATAHVTMLNGQAAVCPLVEGNRCIWWCNRWYVRESDIFQARKTAQLHWLPADPRQDTMLIWWWFD